MFRFMLMFSLQLAEGKQKQYCRPTDLAQLQAYHVDDVSSW